jgi:hypothetical protein
MINNIFSTDIIKIDVVKPCQKVYFKSTNYAY